MPPPEYAVAPVALSEASRLRAAHRFGLSRVARPRGFSLAIRSQSPELSVSLIRVAARSIDSFGFGGPSCLGAPLADRRVGGWSEPPPPKGESSATPAAMRTAAPTVMRTA